MCGNAGKCIWKPNVCELKARVKPGSKLVPFGNTNRCPHEYSGAGNNKRISLHTYKPDRGLFDERARSSRLRVICDGGPSPGQH